MNNLEIDYSSIDLRDHQKISLQNQENFWNYIQNLPCKSEKYIAKLPKDQSIIEWIIQSKSLVAKTTLTYAMPCSEAVTM